MLIMFTIYIAFPCHIWVYHWNTYNPCNHHRNDIRVYTWCRQTHIMLQGNEKVNTQT